MQWINQKSQKLSFRKYGYVVSNHAIITWPNAEVMLFDGFSRFGIIKVPIVHFEFQHIEYALENYVKLLDHFSTAELQFLFEINHNF